MFSVKTMNSKHCMLGIVMLVLAGFPDSTGQPLPEGSVNRLTECEGTILRGSCPTNEVIAVKNIQYGTTNCALNSEAAGCCDYDSADCLTDYTGTTQQAACSGRGLCNDVTVGEEDTRSCGAPYPDLNHYLTMEYYCIPESRIGKMCDSVALTATGSPLYIWNKDYPGGPIRAVSASCSCSIEASSCNSLIKVYFVHFELGDGGGSCTDNQNVKIDDKSSIHTYTCSQNTNYEITTAMTSSSNYVTVTLNNAAGISDGRFWIGFEDCEIPSKEGYVFESASDLSYGSTLGTSCATGYEGPPSVTEMTCTVNGTWSDVTGCNLVDCNTPTKVGYNLGNPAATTYGSTVSVISCETGYSGNPSEPQLTCQDTGSWSEVTGCTFVNCNSPIKVGYNLGTPTATTYGSTVSVVSCDTGYTGNPSPTVLTCQDTGSWSDVSGCTIVNCTNPTIVGYNLGALSATTYGSTVSVVSCDTGYTGSPSLNQLTCQASGSWSDVTGCSIVNCTNPIKVGYNLGTPTATTYGGTVSVVSCDTGYTGNPSPTVLTCQNTGSWSDVSGCTIVDCTDPIKVGYNIGTPSATTYGSTVSVDSCDIGYTGSLSTTELTCQDTGSWSDATGCDIVNCNSPTKVGYNLGTPTATTYGGTVSVVSCDTGYTGNPSPTVLTCQDTGSWSDVSGCTIVNCGPATKVGYTLGTPSTTTYGSTVSVDSCETGYTGTPSQTQLTCQDSGSWSDPTGCFIVDCNEPQKVGYVLGNVAATIFGSSVSVSACEPGYTGTPDVSSITCQENGDWSAVSGCTVGNCNTPTKVGYILGTPSTTTFGVTVEVMSCDTGYNGSPSVDTITCLASGDWSDVSGCVIVDCSGPTKVGYDLGTPLVTTYQGRVSVDSCATGYTGTPSVDNIKCKADGSWSDVTGCQLVNCNNPTLTGYQHGAPSATTYGGTVSVDSCDTGYTGSPSVNTTTCEADGSWSDVSGCDIVNCNSPTKTGYELGNPTTMTYEGTVSVVACDTGYTGTPSVDTITCEADGNWSEVLGCSIVNCGSPTKTGYQLGAFTVTTYRGTVIVDSCDTGYIGTPSVGQIACEASGSWSDVSGCNIVNCNSPSRTGYQLGTYSATTYGSIVSVHVCDTGYTGTPSVNQITCEAGGSWSDLSGCNIVNCNTPTKIGYQLGAPSDMTYGGTVSVNSCETGYTGTPSVNTITCEADGNWSDVIGCNIVNCSSPTKTGYQLGNPTTTTYGGTVSVDSCDTGYTGTPSVAQIVCQVSGRWSDVSGCNIVNCGTLSAPAHGTIQYSAGKVFQSVASYSCDMGYSVVGQSTRICQADAAWSNTDPTCVINDCSTFSGPENGNVTFANGTTYRSVAIYSCNTGYTLFGPSSRECQADGSWTTTDMNCYRDCDSLSAPEYGLVNITATIYDSRATFSCQTGYELDGASILRCQSDGTWSSRTPTCEVIIVADATSKTMMIVLTVLASLFVVGAAAASGLWWKNMRTKPADHYQNQIVKSRHGQSRPAVPEPIKYIRSQHNFVPDSAMLIESKGLRPNINGLHPKLRPEQHGYYHNNRENSTLYSGDTVSGVTVNSNNLNTDFLNTLPEYGVSRLNNLRNASMKHTRSNNVSSV